MQIDLVACCFLLSLSFLGQNEQADGEDELKKRQLMELAIINGTYRDPSAKCQAGGGGGGGGGGGVGGQVVGGVGGGKGADLLSICKFTSFLLNFLTHVSPALLLLSLSLCIHV